jgi:hypothetical protein
LHLESLQRLSPERPQATSFCRCEKAGHKDFEGACSLQDPLGGPANQTALRPMWKDVRRSAIVLLAGSIMILWWIWRQLLKSDKGPGNASEKGSGCQATCRSCCENEAWAAACKVVESANDERKWFSAKTNRAPAVLRCPSSSSPSSSSSPPSGSTGARVGYSAPQRARPSPSPHAAPPCFLSACSPARLVLAFCTLTLFVPPAAAVY